MLPHYPDVATGLSQQMAVKLSQPVEGLDMGSLR